MKRLLGIVLGVAAVGLAVIAPASSQTKTTKLVTQIYIGNYGAKWAYDFADVDPANGLYLLTDRDSKGLDVIDIKHSKVAYQVTGFTGNKGKPEISGPNGVFVIPGTTTAYASDVNSVKVVDLATQKIVKSIPTNTSGNRTDGGCYDPVDKVSVWSLGDDDPPSIAVISTVSAVGDRAFDDDRRRRRRRLHVRAADEALLRRASRRTKRIPAARSTSSTRPTCWPAKCKSRRALRSTAASRPAT